MHAMLARRARQLKVPRPAAYNVAALAYGDWQLTLQKQSAKNAGRLPAAGQWLTFAAVRFRGG